MSLPGRTLLIQCTGWKRLSPALPCVLPPSSRHVSLCNPYCPACAGLYLECAVLLGPTCMHSVAPPLHTDATAVQAFFESGLINVAGCTISTFNSSQQWDFPSSWPPTEWMMITALQNYGGEHPCLCLLSGRVLCAEWALCAAAVTQGLGLL